MMKNLSLFSLFIVFTIFISGCVKDNINYSDVKVAKSKFKTLSSWNNNEKEFFKLNPSGSVQKRTRDVPVIYHPLIIKSYNYLVDQNERHSFVDKITQDVGLANWEKSYVFYNKFDKTNAVIVPLTKSNNNRVNGIISLNIVNGQTIVNGYLRSKVETSIKLSCKDYFIAKQFNILDQKIFNTAPNLVLKEAYCECEDLSPNEVLLQNDCTYRLIELCTDDRSQTGWENGAKPFYPPHMDHDLDGIVNEDDQDYSDLLRRLNATDADITRMIISNWNINMGPEVGPYDEFWEDPEGYMPDDWIDEDGNFVGDEIEWLDSILSDIADFFDGIWDWIIDLFTDNGDDDRNGNGIPDKWDDCDFPNGWLKDNQIELRNIRCEWYYIKDCEGTNNFYNWWNDLDILSGCRILGEMYPDDVEKLNTYLASPTTINPCTGQDLNKDEYFNYLCAEENFNQFNNQNFLNGGAISDEIKLVLSYDLIKEWMASHNNDANAMLIGNQAISSLCGGSSGTGGSGNAVNISYLEAKYMDEVLKIQYPDYNVTNLDQFIDTYGIDRYLQLAQEYSAYQEISAGIITWTELVNIPEVVPNSSSGFYDRTLSCESFIFYPQSGGMGAQGQIACVSGMYLSKSLLGAYTSTEEFCMSFLLPKVRFNGEEVHPLKASDCAARAANTAAAVSGILYADRALDGNIMEDDALIELFKVTFGVKMKLSKCGYGQAANCDQCLSTPKGAVWNTGFFQYLSEELFGCYSSW